MAVAPAEVHGRLVLDDHVEPGRIRIEDGQIATVQLDAGFGDGPILAPGFVDVHVHGFAGYDAMGSGTDLDGMATALLRRGVTSFLPTAVTAPMEALHRFADRVREWRPGAPASGAEPLGFNLEGPFLSRLRKGAHDPAFLRAPADCGPGDLKPLLDGLRLITIAPELSGSFELIATLAERGIAVSLGHSAADLQTARRGYALGARSTTHLFNAMTGVDHHAPGLAVAALTDDAVYTELIADRHHVHPALWPIIFRTKPADRLLLVSDALPLAGSGSAEGTLGSIRVRVDGDRVTIAGGHVLAGSVIALDAAVRNLVAEGASLPAAVAAASRNPLALIGASDRGRIAPGQRADLVALDDDLRVVRVARAGEWREVG